MELWNWVTDTELVVDSVGVSTEEKLVVLDGKNVPEKYGLEE